MVVNVKKIFSPIVCGALGLLNLIFMSMEFLSVKIFSLSVGGASAYSCVDLLNMPTSDGGIILFSVGLCALLLILISIALVAFGVLGILKGILVSDSMQKIPTKLVSGPCKFLVRFNFIVEVLAFILILICGIVTEMACQPGVGNYFLLVFAIAGWIVFVKFGKKLPAVIGNTANNKAKYSCSACGATANANDKFCPSCGAPVVADNSSCCPACGNAVSENDKFCPSCGAQVPARKAFCSSCGTEIGAGVKFCPKCGAPTGSDRN